MRYSMLSASPCSLFYACAWLTAIVLPFTSGLASPPPDETDATVSHLRGIIERYTTDLAAIERRHSVSLSEERAARLRRFYANQSRVLDAVAFEQLDQDGKVDFLLLRNHLRSQVRQLEREQKRFAEVAALLPFAPTVVRLEEARRRVEPVDGAKIAAALTEIAAQVHERQKETEEWLTAQDKAHELPSKAAARRAAGMVDDLRRTLRRWHDFYSGYDPQFSWWAEEPYRKAAKRLEDYAAFLRRKLAGYVEGQDEPIIGDPIGREALLEALEDEMVPYTPEELIEIAGQGFAWCEAEYRRAAQELGFGDDWRKALEHVKGLHVQPGEQPKLIQELAEEAIHFLEARDLVTIPPLCKETWRMEMMPPERQKVNPYFTGGEVISVSFPTDAMSHEDRVMSLRGNNIAFCRATVHHELIPGHHLQGFMAARHKTHRRIFRTPFLGEGWALYWEMLLWDLGFPKTPEDRIGMLFWRSHRSARIVFSLKFHLGEMSAQEAVDYLVERVGHERRNAEAEVRRSVWGDYGPLYQAAYMLGGLQLRALRAELVDSGRMKDRAFHDSVLRENSIPVAMIRASLLRQPLARDFDAAWRFHPAGPRVVAPATPDGAGADRSSLEPRGRRRTPAVLRERIEPHWLAGGAKLWYRVDLPEGQRGFVLVDAENASRGPAFDHAHLAEALARSAGEAVDPQRLPLESLEISDDLKSLRFAAKGRSWRCDLESYAVSEVKDRPADGAGRPEEPRRREGRRRGPGAASRSARSPDGRWEAFVRGHNLHLRELETGKEETLTSDASADDSYARDVRRERAVELEYDAPEAEPAAPEVYWSPDSRRLIAMRTRPGTERKVYLIESSPKDQLQPKLHSYPYLKPGDDVPVRKPRLFDVEATREVPVSDALFPTPWSIGDLRWAQDSSRFTFLYNQRGHQVLRIVRVDALSGETRAVVDERSETFVDYSGKFFSESLDETQEVVWMSERDGWNHLYVYDARSGQVRNQITRGEWVVRGVERVDPEKRQVWFRAGGIRPGQDPYYVHYCRVDFDGTRLVVLTEGDGTHSVQFSPDRRYFVDTWSRVDQPPAHELRSSEDGRLVCELERADAGELYASGWRPPERFAAKGRDGTTDIYGVIHRPRDLDPARSYPVIESIYAGPQGSFVPKSFRASHGQDDLTRLGFMVVQIDGMGTSNRSKQFHDVAWKNLGDAGFPDRILWMQAAAARYPYMDLSRVGIFGGSAGGQNALRGLLAHGDFYKVGAADCGCHDNRMDKIWWNEQWMGWPVGPHYEEQSNAAQAHRLQGKLLLSVGELDRNVDPASTMQVVNALIRADKDFDLVVVPGAGHGAGGSPYGRRRRNDFFVRHLLGVEPERAVAASASPADGEGEREARTSEVRRARL
jgi:dipeptidyl aminopeptidase/acylaminoacyl peptidase